MAKRNGLGKGLDALFIDNNTEDGAITALKISEVEPNKNQPRTVFDDAALSDLADSLREHGIIQPLVVRPMDAGGYQIVAGERRWRAARMAGLSEVPVIIRELDDEQTLQLAIIENLQREDLNPLELAVGYQTLMKQHGMTQEQVAAKLGKSRSVIANTIRLLALPPTVQTMLQDGSITFGHARALLSLEDPKLLQDTAQRVVREGLLVRDIERIGRNSKKELDKWNVVRENSSTGISKEKESNWGDSYLQEMELALTTELGRKVKISGSGNKILLQLECYSTADLKDIAARLTKNNE